MSCVSILDVILAKSRPLLAYISYNIQHYFTGCLNHFCQYLCKQQVCYPEFSYKRWKKQTHKLHLYINFIDQFYCFPFTGLFYLLIGLISYPNMFQFLNQLVMKKMSWYWILNFDLSFDRYRLSWQVLFISLNPSKFWLS